MTIISIVSPHIDDAIFSLGPYLEQLQRVHELSVINVFSVCRFAFGREMDTNVVTALRKAEDAIALSAIGIRSVHYLDLPEALLRGYGVNNLRTHAESPIVADEEVIVKELTTRLRPLIMAEDVVFVPAAFGSHIDHLDVREASQKLGAPLVYYADLPYAADKIRYDHENAVRFTRTMNQGTVRLNQDSVEHHIALCRFYESQFAPRFVQTMTEYLHREHYALWSRDEFATLGLDI